MNCINIIGNLGRDPETRFTPSGKQVCNVSMAVDSGFGDNKITSWIDIVCWAKTAEVVSKYARKGDRLAVSGRFQTRTFTTKEGVKKTLPEIVAENVTFIESRESSQVQEEVEQPIESDIPF